MDKKTFAWIFVLSLMIFAAGCEEKALEPTVTAPMTGELSSGATTTTPQPPGIPAEAQGKTQETAPQVSGEAQEPLSPAEFLPPSEKEIQQALKNAAEIITDHFKIISEVDVPEAKATRTVKALKEKKEAKAKKSK